MSLEDALINFAWVFGGLAAAYSFARLYFNHARAIAVQKAKTAPNQNAIQNPLANYSSFREIANTAVSLLDKQCQEIAAACEKKGEQYMKNTGYLTVKSQFDAALKWKTRFENPLWSMADEMFFPIAKQAGIDFMKSMPRLMKGVTSF